MSTSVSDSRRSGRRFASTLGSVDDDTRYQAVRSRDGRFDGEFFTAVRTTGIYCRPSCPAVPPKRRNVRFYPSAAAAQAAGFRACRRCRPDAVPGSAAWNARADLVARAMRMIADGVVDRDGVAGLARRLGYSPRQVQRQLLAELGAGPVALARAQRAHTARILLQTTSLPITEIAFASGFASVRQFNDTVREIYGGPPGSLRAAAPRRGTAGGGAAAHGGPRGVPLRLAHRGPYAVREIFDFLARRAVPGIEEVRGAPGARCYRRSLRLPHGVAIAEVDERPGTGRSGAVGGWLACRLHLTELRDLTTAVQRLRQLFDLDADPCAAAELLGTDPRLAALVAAAPGMRSPGAVDPSEAAIRAVLGQQVTVGAANALTAALVAAYGEPVPSALVGAPGAPGVSPEGGRGGGVDRLFPAPQDLAGATLTELRMPVSRRRAVRRLAAALADGAVDLGPGADRDRAEHALCALPGIGPWTTGCIRMRALGDPDVFLSGDAGARHGLRRIGAAAGASDRWRPWRSYALHHVWNAALRPAHPVP